MYDLVRRAAESRLKRLSASFRVVVVNGPRQAGKTTLLNQVGGADPGEFRTLDDEATLTGALADPQTFAGVGRRPLIVDEIQRGGDALLRAIKYVVDNEDSPGQFILSGSTRFLTVPTLSESLAGRAVFLDLWPFSVAERTDDTSDFGTRIFDEPASLLDAGSSPWERDDYLELICTGGYPEVVRLSDAESRTDWFDGYLRTVLQRDVRSFAAVQHLEMIPKLLGMVAARTGSPVVVSDLAQAVELAQPTVRNYLSYLDMVFLTVQVPAWSTNLTKKAAKFPRTFVSDSGLHAYLLGVTPQALRQPGHRALGGLVEAFVHDELTRLLSVAAGAPAVRYLRDRDGHEIDLILERRDGTVVAVEVKSSATVSPTDSRHLAWLRDKIGDQLAAGIVLYLGRHSVSLGDRLYGLPLSSLWGHALL